MSLASILSAVQQGVTAMNNLGSQVKTTFAQAPLIPSFWNFPTTAGSSGQFLTSAGGGPQFWTTVDQYVSSTILSSQAVTLVSGAAKDVASISLSSGNWEVWGGIAFLPGPAASMTICEGWINNVSATNPTFPNSGAFFLSHQSFPVGTAQVFPTGATTFSLSSTNTVYLTVLAVFSSDVTTDGFIKARSVP